MIYSSQEGTGGHARHITSPSPPSPRPSVRPPSPARYRGRAGVVGDAPEAEEGAHRRYRDGGHQYGGQGEAILLTRVTISKYHDEHPWSSLCQ